MARAAASFASMIRYPSGWMNSMMSRLLAESIW